MVFPLRKLGTWFLVIRLASSSTTEVLPTPASPSRRGLFLFFLFSTSITLVISFSLPITGSNSLFNASLFKFLPIVFNILLLDIVLVVNILFFRLSMSMLVFIRAL